MSDGENERAMIQDMGDSAGENAGSRRGKKYSQPTPILPLRAGRSTKPASPAWAPTRKNPSHQFQQTHDIKNLFVMDASGFTSNPCQNPTLTIMALCVRSCDYLMSELKRNAI